jgi:gamma-polyglutamate biosynthesis protein CapA
VSTKLRKLLGILFGAIFVLAALGAYSPWKISDLVDIDFKNTNPKTTFSLEVVSFVVPHHLVAEGLIEEAFAKVAEENGSSKIERVILISPNHFNLGRNWVSVSEKKWKTKNGEVLPDISGIGKMKKLEEISLEEEAFRKEHGIENIVPFIAKYFPEAKVLPLMVKDGFPLEKARNLAENLAENFSQKTILILSSDFSHELEKNVSQFHDIKTLESIKTRNYSKFYDMDTDCAPGLAIMTRYSEVLGYGKFKVLANSNSSEIYQKNFIGENTSYITGFFSKGENENVEKTVGLMFFGDVMLDRHNRNLADKNGALWFTQKIRRIFWGQDENIINLEGPITNSNSVSLLTKENERNHFVFTFKPEDARVFLRENKIGLVSIGNNHTLNFGEKGLLETKSNLDNFGVEYFGDPKDENNFLSKEINGMRIGFLNHNQFSGISVEKTVEKIKKLKDEENDFLIVYTHWGQEYEMVQNKKQRKLAHLFIDSGADLIVGSHPHVIQPVEIYRNKAIFYSLGNFVFDQYFSQEVRERLAVGVLISKNEVSYYLSPLYTEKNGQLVLADEKIRKKILDRMAENSLVKDSEKEGIRQGKFSSLKN